MKIGVLTFHWAQRFGALLQEWSLYKLLTDMGYEVKIINFQPAPLVIWHWQLKLSDMLFRRYIPRERPLTRTFFQALGVQINALFIRNEVRVKKVVRNFYEEVFGRTLLKEKKQLLA